MNEIVDLSERDNGFAPGELVATGRALQQVRTSYCTAVAVQRPRDLARVEKNLLAEARLSEEEFFYGWGSGKNRVEGPSVGLALAAARCWGNCAVETPAVEDQGDAWVFTATFIDLETGFTLTRPFRQSKKWVVHGQMDGERKDDVRFQIGASKAVRNVVLNALPKGLIKRALEEAHRGVRTKLEADVKQHGLAAIINKAISVLGKLGVKEEAILARFGVAKREALTVDHLTTLKGDAVAIESGQEFAHVLFPPPLDANTQRLAEQLAAPAPANGNGNGNGAPAETPASSSAPTVTAPPVPAPAEPPAKASAKVVRELYDLAAKLELTSDQVSEELDRRYFVGTIEDLLPGQAKDLLTDWKKKLK